MSFGALLGNRVELVPLEEEHAEPLFACSRSDRVWEFLPIHVRTLEEMSSFIRIAIDARNRGEEYPYAVYDRTLGRFVGTTRYLRISSQHRGVNIGWTWYSDEVWRTAVNTECKYLLLRQAFESWGAVRVEIIATTTNVRSQQAIERLGAVREGVLRKKYSLRDYVCYSILDDEWPVVRARLENWLT